MHVFVALLLDSRCLPQLFSPYLHCLDYVRLRDYLRIQAGLPQKLVQLAR